MTAPHTPPAELPDVAAIEARAAAAAHAAREYRYCRDCGAVDSSGRAGWMCRTCGTILPSDCPDAKATAIAAKVARDLGCADLDDVPDALKRVLADNADAEIHRRVLTEQSDAQRTRADAAEEALTRLRSKHAAVYRQATHDRELRVAAEEALTTAREERDAARAEADALRAIVEGRTVATSDDAAAHALAHPLPTPGAASNGATCDEPIGLWLCVVDGEGAAVLRLAHESDDQGPYLMAWSSDYGWCGTGDIRRAWPLDASGRPCPWPTVAAEAATGAALAREGR